MSRSGISSPDECLVHSTLTLCRIFTCLFVYLFVCLFIYSFILSFINSYVLSFVCHAVVFIAYLFVKLLIYFQDAQLSLNPAERRHGNNDVDGDVIR